MQESLQVTQAAKTYEKVQENEQVLQALESSAVISVVGTSVDNRAHVGSRSVRPNMAVGYDARADVEQASSFRSK
jgi:hypothetical protein